VECSTRIHLSLGDSGVHSQAVGGAIMKVWVDYEFGSWVVKTDEGKRAILLVKDIDGFRNAIFAVKEQTRLRQMSEKFNDMLEFIEFGEVQVQKNGMVRWQGGKFVDDCQ
jgi:hypothetical protein